MPFVTKRQPLSLSVADRERLEDLRRSRIAEKRQVLHAAMLLDCANGASDNAVAVANGVNRHTVALCIRKFLQFGMDAALGELPRPGKSRRIPDDAIAWVCSVPVRSRRISATPTNSGRTPCCRATCGSHAWRRTIPACSN